MISIRLPLPYSRLSVMRGGSPPPEVSNFFILVLVEDKPSGPTSLFGVRLRFVTEDSPTPRHPRSLLSDTPVPPLPCSNLRGWLLCETTFELARRGKSPGTFFSFRVCEEVPTERRYSDSLPFPRLVFCLFFSAHILFVTADGFPGFFFFPTAYRSYVTCHPLPSRLVFTPLIEL